MMAVSWVMNLFSTLFGLALGSFLNVVIYRVPERMSFIAPGSACPKCRTPIAWYDNIPVLSYLILRGRCRHCRAPISWSYPVVEAAAGALSLALFIKYGWSIQYLLWMIFFCALLTLSAIDLQRQIIPDWISLPGIAAGIIAAFLAAPLSWADSLIGAVAGGLSLLLIAVGYELLTGKQGMGGGDIKLLAMIGAWMGWRALPFIVLISSLSGSVIGILFLLLSRKDLGSRIPFGPFLSLGALIYFFFAPNLHDWYDHIVLQGF